MRGPPTLKQAAIVYEPLTAPYMASIVRSVVAAGPTFGVTIDNVGEVESAIAALGQKSNTGLIVPPAYFTLTNSPLIIALATKYRLPAIYAHRTIVTEGGSPRSPAIPASARRRCTSRSTQRGSPASCRRSHGERLRR
jgi:hypothetical protein